MASTPDDGTPPDDLPIERAPIPPRTPDVEPGLQPALGGPFVSLRQRDFRFLWFGTVFVGFGQWGQQIALNWLVFVLTGSAVQLGAVSFVGGILSLVITPYAGVLADRYSRRMIMLLATIVGAVQAAVLAVLVFADLVQVWHAYGFAVVAALTQAMNQPARQAYVNDVSTPETLPNAIALNSIAQNVSRIVGPPLFGALAVLSLGAAFAAVTVVRVIASMLTILLSRREQSTTDGRGNPFTLIIGGFSYLFRESHLRQLLLVNALTALFVYPYVSFMPVFAEDVFGGDSGTYGLLVSMIAVGSIVGLFGLAWLPNLKRRGLLMLIGFMGYTVLLVSFTFAPFLLLALVLLAVAGLFFGIASALNNTLFQILVRNDMRGRGMAVLQVAGGLSPIGALTMGLLIETIGIRHGVALHIAIAFVGMLLVVIWGRSIRRL